ncbi:MAG TPA: hypothetical protein VF013_10365 [Candidatus Limnocylindria bacterium]
MAGVAQARARGERAQHQVQPQDAARQRGLVDSNRRTAGELPASVLIARDTAGLRHSRDRQPAATAGFKQCLAHLSPQLLSTDAAGSDRAIARAHRSIIAVKRLPPDYRSVTEETR